MRRYQNWVAALGLLAVTPAVSFAGPFSLSGRKADARPARQVAEVDPQELSDSISTALADARLDVPGNEIEILTRNGVAVLSGTVRSQRDLATALKTAQAVPGVSRVQNNLKVSQAVAAKRPARRAAGPIQRASYAQDGMENAGAEMMPPGMMAGPQAPGQYMQAGGFGPAPQYGMGPAMPGGAVYNQPNFPETAWPSYAAYPNYAAVSYPSQYSASAFPYIGPFYPYPQVPLGWRKAQLEWDDGYWRLNFRPRTDRWWWFMDYRNW